MMREIDVRRAIQLREYEVQYTSKAPLNCEWEIKEGKLQFYFNYLPEHSYLRIDGEEIAHCDLISKYIDSNYEPFLGDYSFETFLNYENFDALKEELTSIDIQTNKEMQIEAINSLDTFISEKNFECFRTRLPETDDNLYDIRQRGHSSVRYSNSWTQLSNFDFAESYVKEYCPRLLLLKN